jgi:hypothetical protein
LETTVTLTLDGDLLWNEFRAKAASTCQPHNNRDQTLIV